MGFKKVELTKEEEDALAGGNYFKFNAVGTKLLGRFIKTQPQTGTYAKKDLEDYVFKVAAKDEDGQVIPGKTEEVVVNTSLTLNAQLKKCNLKPGYAVKITFASEIEIGKPSKKKIFEVEYDDSPPKGAAAPPPPPPAAGEADDLTF